jgi:hypothetical protein
MVGMAIGFVALLFCLFWLSSGINRFKSLSMSIGFIQITSFFAEFSIPWPSQLRELFRALSFFNFNIEITRVSRAS